MKGFLFFIISMLGFQYVIAQSGAPHVEPHWHSDSVKVAASDQYRPVSLFRKILTGKNYRKEWSTPVTLPVLDLEKTGLRIVKMGGGMQTKSLRLADAAGREWALRTVDKFAEGAIPSFLKNTAVEKIVQDMISASYPYAAVTVGALAEAAGIVAPKPVVYFVPDDPFLGPYREHFANMVCYLERRDPVPGTEDTEDFIEDKLENNQILVVQKEILRARLLDMLVADWDRHEGQWLWAPLDTGEVDYYYPVPLDRDQAFFISGGILPRLAKALVMPHLNGFKERSKNLKNLSYKAWEFDRYFLNALDSREWTTVIRDFKASIPDEVIWSAVNKLPSEILVLSGEKIARTLISRRNTLEENAMKYYEFLASTVDVTGTGENEIFHISSGERGIVVSAYRLVNGERGQRIYERIFDPRETKRISVFGLQGDDHFLVEEGVDRKIRLKIHGDEGKDVYNINGTARSKIYDLRAEDNLLVNLGSSKMLFED